MTDLKQRLAELEAAYASISVPHSFWAAHSSRIDLDNFRGHYQFMSQDDEFPYRAIVDHIKSSESLNKFYDKLQEDGAFGCRTWVVDDKIVSRDLLDSIMELGFLAETLPAPLLEPLHVLDIGAGYGRFADRLSCVTPDFVYATDAVAVSTVVCERYLRFRRSTARAVPLHELESLPHIDLAVNIHSWSECTPESINFWLDWLVAHEVRWLFVVPHHESFAPNGPAGGRSFRLDIEEHGYELVASKKTEFEPIAASGAYYHYLFELKVRGSGSGSSSGGGSGGGSGGSGGASPRAVNTVTRVMPRWLEVLGLSERVYVEKRVRAKELPAETRPEISIDEGPSNYEKQAAYAEQYVRDMKAPPGMKSIGLVIIAKNEAAVLPRAIASVGRLVDSITVVLDQTNSDNTEEALLGVDPRRVLRARTPFAGLAAARNEAVEMALECWPGMGYVLMLDADDVIEKVSDFKIDPAVDGYEVTIHDGSLRYGRIVIFRAGMGFKYTFVAHETRDPSSQCAHREDIRPDLPPAARRKRIRHAGFHARQVPARRSPVRGRTSQVTRPTRDPSSTSRSPTPTPATRSTTSTGRRST